MKKSYRPEDWIEQIILRYEHKLYRTALAILSSKEDAVDVLQEVFIKALCAPDFTSDQHEKAWFIRVTVNLCKSKLRTPWRKKRAPLLETYPAWTAPQQELLDSVMQLPPKYRTVIHLFYYEGYSIKEISALTQQKEATVRSLLSRARQKLGSLLKEEDRERL